MTEQEPKQTILAIDGSMLQLQALKQILGVKYNLLTANNGAQGIEMAQKHNVDIILLAMIMSGMSGFEVLSQLKESEETRHIPVIFVTSRDSSEEEIKGLSLGAVDYIRKPFVPAIVNLRINIHLQLIAQMKLIERFSLTDGLTGVNNRRRFDQTAKIEWNRAARTQEWLGLLLLDIDKFKVFNDTYGHLNGDSCLKVVANVMKETVLRGTDLVFRWGGEEFAVLMPNTPIDGAVTVAERVRKNIMAAPVDCNGEIVNVTASIGVGSLVPSRGNFDEGFKDFCSRIDKALYRAKANGRNRVEMI